MDLLGSLCQCPHHQVGMDLVDLGMVCLRSILHRSILDMGSQTHRPDHSNHHHSTLDRVLLAIVYNIVLRLHSLYNLHHYVHIQDSTILEDHHLHIHPWSKFHLGAILHYLLYTIPAILCLYMWEGCLF